MASPSKTPRDVVINVLGFGPGGTPAPVSMKLAEGLKPGSIGSVVVDPDEDLCIDIKDGKHNILLRIFVRVTTKGFALNSYINGKWGDEEVIKPVPTEKNIRFVATVVYEKEGYRIFINEDEVKFFKHRWNTPAVLAEVDKGMVYKMAYVSSTNNVPN